MTTTPVDVAIAIRCEGVTKIYKDGTKAVDALDLTVEDGRLLALVGPSGCGKTTLLRMIAGLEHISGGTLSIGGRVVNQLPPQARDIAMVFQNYALYPHMTVFDNMAFGLRIRKVSRDEIRKRVHEAAELLGLTASLKKKPAHLSGGQRQRVAMGRAIVREPTIYLMDEPLSNLDAQLRVDMRSEIARLQRRLGVTTVYVTHDQTEAMVLGDMVAVLKDGVLQQHATPAEVYGRPANAFVARFIGSPSMNLFEGTLEHTAAGTTVTLGQSQLGFGTGVIEAGRSLGAGPHQVLCGIRPEALEEVAGDGPGGRPILRGTVELREELGPELFVYVNVEGAPPSLGGFMDDDAADDDAPIEASRLTVARLTPRSRAREGERIELTVDPAGVHLFDAATQVRLD